MLHAQCLNASQLPWMQDCHDDGEAGGGIRLLHMLQDSQAVNVMVVVTRW